ncbi:Rossmann-like and DUF2520 domain-containing protein [Porphyromonas loveana]|uniref:Putative short-subunit dehydrogenase-like oxidoreductase (DUF2520 family) n=1 Tax=Porphyromonas loveana TaxID=1884669 RepID=A0A2U1FCC3_9PORP|nr:Rossmann-like and DUF2520 domain-containing protein [Porphyromonas loveana]PVZ09818.1 putative short-subunit dehydrogenase-like oxidoreductase (DUF2520 family) [Porphyromonas loveana]
MTDSIVKSDTPIRIVLIGSGNLATQTALALSEAGHPPVQVWSRRQANAEQLATMLPQATATDNMGELLCDADLYLLAVSDHALASVAASMPVTQGVWAHTAGSIPLSVLVPHHAAAGVFYPLQTFSRERRVDYMSIPIYIEGSNETVTTLLETVGQSISREVHRTTSEQRLYLHLAAVWACNFTNHLYALSEQLLQEHGLPRQALAPLIAETAAKVQTMSAQEAQTGPAKRNDTNVLQKHLDLLADHPDRLELYRALSDSIIRMYHQED